MFRVLIVGLVALVSMVACVENEPDRGCSRNDDCDDSSCCVFEEDSTDGICVAVSSSLVISAEGLCPQACGATADCTGGLTCFAEAERFCAGDEPEGSCVVADDQQDAVRCE